MPQSSFGEALSRLWPSGDAKIPRLRAGIIAAAPAVFAKHGITNREADIFAHRLAPGPLAARLPHKLFE